MCKDLSMYLMETQLTHRRFFVVSSGPEAPKRDGRREKGTQREEKRGEEVDFVMGEVVVMSL